MHIGFHFFCLHSASWHPAGGQADVVGPNLLRMQDAAKVHSTNANVHYVRAKKIMFGM